MPTIATGYGRNGRVDRQRLEAEFASICTWGRTGNRSDELA
jgi:hypothetical protein